MIGSLKNKLLANFQILQNIITAPPTKFFAFLETKDLILIDARPKKFRPPRWFDKIFYPPNKGQRMALADKAFLPVIILSIVILFYEESLERDFVGFAVLSSQVFLGIFLFEFLCRLYLRRLTYLKTPTGALVDFPAMLGDVLFLLAEFGILNSMLGSEVPSEVLRFFRLLRFIRIFRLARYVLYWGNIKKFAIIFSMYLWAFFKSIAIVVLIFISPAVFAYLIGWNVDEIWLYVAPLLEFSDIFKDAAKSSCLGENFDESSFVNTLCETIPKSPIPADEAIGRIYQLLVYIAIFVVSNVILLVFAPAARSIAVSSRATIAKNILLDHVIIFVGKDHDVLEELAYVFSSYEHRDVVFILNEEEEFGTSFPKSIFVRKGSLESRMTWNNVNASGACTIVFFNAPEIVMDGLEYTIINPDLNRKKMPRLINVNENCKLDLVTKNTGSLFFNITNVPMDKIREQISDTIWKPDSPQYAIYTGLIDRLDDKFVFPKNRKEKSNSVTLSHLDLDQNKFDQERAHIRLEDNNLIIAPAKMNEQSYPDTHRVAIVGKLVADHREKLRNLNVFCYVNDFYLFECNRIYREDDDLFVNIFAIEFAIAMAIFHESHCYGAAYGWLGESIDLIDVSGEKVGYFWNRKGIIEDKSALYIVRKCGKIDCFLDDSDKILISEGDKIAYIQV